MAQADPARRQAPSRCQSLGAAGSADGVGFIDIIDLNDQGVRRRLVFVVIEVLLAVRFVFKLGNANASQGIAAAIYACSLTGLFATSSLYNRLLGTVRLRPWMRWLDHSMIYVLIAGSYTPVCWVALPRRWSIPLLAVVWTAALGGVLLKVTKLRRLRRLGGALYVTMGWVSVLVLPKLFESLQLWAAGLLITGGALYTVGAVTLWLRKPNPSPHFGYHEVWHSFVVVAGACHFAMTWLALNAS